ncbi:MAG TPA: LysM peptidoglycan-binding domain-containing protein, partial [Gammaproteobacteria bacterium]|nr:LysM peptidoglycan-binding domain-containing protein [Gammaproteobacteria bacterium]
NAADLIGGVSLDDKDDILASVLLDLSQTATIEASTTVAGKVLKQLGEVNKLHKPHVEQAGFAVLKSPDIPSILVETAFISNPKEERKLKSVTHQKKLARAILSGVRSYFRKYPPPGTTLALRSAGEKYIIKRGDTLSTIARRYRVRMDELRHNNGLRDDLLRVGDVLLIPGTLGG